MTFNSSVISEIQIINLVVTFQDTEVPIRIFSLQQMVRGKGFEY